MSKITESPDFLVTGLNSKLFFIEIGKINHIDTTEFVKEIVPKLKIIFNGNFYMRLIDPCVKNIQNKITMYFIFNEYMWTSDFALKIATLSTCMNILKISTTNDTGGQVNKHIYHVEMKSHFIIEKRKTHQTIKYSGDMDWTVDKHHLLQTPEYTIVETDIIGLD
jgi:hypothetical protein